MIFITIWLITSVCLWCASIYNWIDYKEINNDNSMKLSPNLYLIHLIILGAAAIVNTVGLIFALHAYMAQ